MEFDTLRYEVDGGLCRLTLNRPDHRNGMTNIDASFRDDTETLLTALLEKSPRALLGLKQNCVAAERMTLRDFVEKRRPVFG